MALAPRQRWLILGGALIVTLGLVVWMGSESDEAVVAPAERPAAQARTPAEPGKDNPAAPAARAQPAPGTAPGLRAGRSDPGNGPAEVRDIFAQQTWHVPPPPAPPGPPEAPPLPFEYVGKIIDNGQVTVYLEDEEDRNLAVRQGDVINGIYRVKRITPQAVTFVYIPMNKQQILEIGSPN